MTPKIDYALLGQAVTFYQSLGYEYVEVPWAVERMFIDATLDPMMFNPMAIGSKSLEGKIERVYAGEDCLVGSAEQGFLSLSLLPGKYVGVTPCFRNEEETNLFYQDMFMKVELFANLPDARHEVLLEDASRFVATAIGNDEFRSVREVKTAEGVDLLLGGTEIGSYGVRDHDEFGRWAYGTGLALPRFSVARALAKVL